MRKTLYCIVLLTLTSCLTIYFEQPQPVGSKPLENFPEKMRGAYVNDDQDTAYVLADRYVFYEKNELKAEILSENMVLKKQGKYLVLSDKDDDKQYWNVYLLTIQKNGDITILINGDFFTEDSTPDPEDKKDGNLEDFYEITNFMKLDKNEYLVNPSRKEFKKLIKEGLFADTFQLKRIEAPFPSSK